MVYDAAHAFNVQVNGTDIGKFGNASMFSLHGTRYLIPLRAEWLFENQRKCWMKLFQDQILVYQMVKQFIRSKLKDE